MNSIRTCSAFHVSVLLQLPPPYEYKMVVSLSTEISVTPWALVTDSVTVVPMLSTSSVEPLLTSFAEPSLLEFSNALLTFD